MRSIGSARRSAWKWAMAAGGVAIGGYFVLPGGTSKSIAYVVIGLASTLGMALAMRLHRPDDRLCWRLLIAGNLLSVAGDATENIVFGLVLHRQVPFPSIADGFYLAAYPFIFAGIARLARSQDRAGRREDYADASIVALAGLAVSWHFVMAPHFHDETMATFGKLVTLAYPVMDLAVLFILARSVLFGTSRLAVHKIVATAVVSMLVADSVYDVLVLHNGYQLGNPIDAGWLLNYVLMSVAALHPTIAAPTRAGPEASPRRRVPLLALAGPVAPGILVVSSLVGAPVDVPVIAGTSVVVFVLVTLRMSWLFDRVRSQAQQLELDSLALKEVLGQRHALESDLRYRAFHDGLTGLANRSLLRSRLEQALAAPAGASRALGLLLCDLDNFKAVNDSLGHSYGDQVLAVAGARLASLVRPQDTVARFGGDEFAVLVEDVTSAAVTDVAERVVTLLRQPIEVDGQSVVVSVSVGVALAGAGKGADQLLSEADMAMYAAKAGGKGRQCSFETSMHRQSTERLELINAFRGALERDEFFLQYQPQFALSGERLEGFEALLRWDHPTMGVIPAARFIVLAEETGFIVALGRWALARACEYASTWETEHDLDLVVAVNVSGRQLRDEHLCEDVRAALALSELPASRLVLEFNESALMTDPGTATKTLTRLKELGVQLALDDFGTGYSALSYLRRLPLDVLKIDKTFVDPLRDPGPVDAEMVSTIIRFSHVLGLRTVAEGIEHGMQRDALTALGCDSGQGSLMGRPLDPANARALMVGCALRQWVAAADHH